jgi:hypothetical protein
VLSAGVLIAVALWVPGSAIALWSDTVSHSGAKGTIPANSMTLLADGNTVGQASDANHDITFEYGLDQATELLDQLQAGANVATVVVSLQVVGETYGLAGLNYDVKLSERPQDSGSYATDGTLRLFPAVGDTCSIKDAPKNATDSYQGQPLVATDPPAQDGAAKQNSALWCLSVSYTKPTSFGYTNTAKGINQGSAQREASWNAYIVPNPSDEPRLDVVFTANPQIGGA